MERKDFFLVGFFISVKQLKLFYALLNEQALYCLINFSISVKLANNYNEMQLKIFWNISTKIFKNLNFMLKCKKCVNFSSLMKLLK